MCSAIRAGTPWYRGYFVYTFDASPIATTSGPAPSNCRRYHSIPRPQFPSSAKNSGALIDGMKTWG